MITFPIYNHNVLMIMVSSGVLSPSVGFQAEAVPVDRRRSCRLYPSLPKVDRQEVRVLEGAAAHRLQSRSTDSQVNLHKRGRYVSEATRK